MNNIDTVKNRVIEVLREIYDSELPIINIYDLGLIKKINIDENYKKIFIEIIFTAGPMCPVADMMALQVKYAIKRALPEYEVMVDVDLRTRWKPNMATVEGRRLLEEIFGKEYLENLNKDKISIKINPEQYNFNILDYMRQKMEERYKALKEWIEKRDEKLKELQYQLSKH